MDPRVSEWASIELVRQIISLINPPLELNSAYRINDIHFAHNSFELSVKSKFILGEFVSFLLENPSLKVSIHGHTDNIGEIDFNYVLSKNRAEAAYSFLTSQGVDVNRLTYNGFGESKPVSSNNSEYGRSLNRRTEFMIIGK